MLPQTHVAMRILVVCAIVAGTLAAQSPAPPRERHAELEGGRLWFTDSGGTGQPVGFVHAATGSSRVWEYQVPAFTDAATA
jgi:pimeloyl-ACP methyl ester carboxylesterase